MKKAVIILILVGIFVPLTWVVLYKYEGTSPEVEISLPSEYLKKSYEMALTVRDGGTGLRRVMV